MDGATVGLFDGLTLIVGFVVGATDEFGCTVFDLSVGSSVLRVVVVFFVGWFV